MTIVGVLLAALGVTVISKRKQETKLSIIIKFIVMSLLLSVILTYSGQYNLYIGAIIVSIISIVLLEIRGEEKTSLKGVAAAFVIFMVIIIVGAKITA